jgi:hypothetical protein
MTKSLIGLSLLLGVALVGDEVATGIGGSSTDVRDVSKMLKEFEVSKTVESKRLEEKLGTPQAVQCQDILFKPRYTSSGIIMHF